MILRTCVRCGTPSTDLECACGAITILNALPRSMSHEKGKDYAATTLRSDRRAQALPDGG